MSKGLIRFAVPIEIGTQIIKEILLVYIMKFPLVELHLNFSSATFIMQHGVQVIAIRNIIFYMLLILSDMFSTFHYKRPGILIFI